MRWRHFYLGVETSPEDDGGLTDGGLIDGGVSLFLTRGAACCWLAMWSHVRAL